MPEGSETAVEGANDDINGKVKWVIPQRLGNMTFVGKDILAVAHDIYILFFNLKTNSELVYVANNEEVGDGVDVLAGHRSNVFAFSEKVRNGRILVMTYPSFKILAEMHDKEVNRYKGLCMMENDLVAAFSGFPNYIMTVWSWRTHQRLISVSTGVVRKQQLYMSSRTHMLICECWGEGLIVWEVAQCFKRCFVMKRVKEEVVSWEVSEPPLVGVCWSIEGHLYAIDQQANLYSVASDGIGMVTQLEWDTEGPGGPFAPHICAFGNGLLVYGSDGILRSLKKAESCWKVGVTVSPRGQVARLVSNGTGDMAAAWTTHGLVYKITGESEDKIEITPMVYKQRNIIKMQMLAPDNEYLVTMNDSAELCIYEISSGKLMLMKHVEGADVQLETSPVEPVLAVFGCRGSSYGMSLYELRASPPELARVARLAFTHQIVSRVVFSPTGRELVAAAMSAGHVFIYKLSVDFKLTLVRYTELGRGLADCFLMKVGEAMRCFCLVLFSDKFSIGERIVCINAESGKDNKFAGKMLGPYKRLLPLNTPDHILAIPHMSRSYHVCKLSADKGVTVSVKMGPIIDSAHVVKHFDGFFNNEMLLTVGFDGNVVIRQADSSEDYEMKVLVSHRYEAGVRSAAAARGGGTLAHLACNHVCAVRSLRGERAHTPRDTLDLTVLDDTHVLTIISDDDKTYLEQQEEKKVREEAMDYRSQREEVVRGFEAVQTKVVALLEENIAERMLHQLSLAEFNLHLEHKKERNKQAEREREEIRLMTEARIRAQDLVTAWIKEQCWDTMLTPRVKLFAIFTHYQVENYPVLPSQRAQWPELAQAQALRLLEMENDLDLFKPWEEPVHVSLGERSDLQVEESPEQSVRSGSVRERAGSPHAGAPQPHALSGSAAHRCVPPPAFTIPPLRAYSFLQMNYLQHIVKLTVQNIRLWFNKQFDDLMALKKREVNLVQERNNRLRFIVEELNKLSDLRGSFHHLMLEIRDPEWQQEELPDKLVKVDPAECSIEPYISPSQVVVPAPEPGPRDDFKERALADMMDGVLEKLWHEEIKKPIPMPQCMLDKDPEHFNEEDLRFVFEYEAKVAFRNEERDKYRKMLHAEYAKLSQVLNEGIVKFNQRVKEMWLNKLRADSIIGQENLNLMRLRRTNLDRVEMAEKLEDMRNLIKRNEQEVEVLTNELQQIQEQSGECQATYDQLSSKDKYMERTFKNSFADLSPIIVDQCYKFFKKRPKWQARATLTPAVLYELAGALQAPPRPASLHRDCLDYCRGLEQLDQVSNMPPVMDEGLWATMCKLRRAKIENEVRMRGVCVEMSYVESAGAAWARAAAARRALLALTHERVTQHRLHVQLCARDRTVQLVLPAGQVEIVTTGHIEDFEDATLILKEDIEKINNVILAVGDMKLRMMKSQMQFRKGILSKEWEHAQMMMKLRHMEQELHSYRRLKIPKELQLYLKNKELGYTEEQEFVRMEKEMEASKMAVNRGLDEEIHRVEELQLKVNAIESQSHELEQLIAKLNVKVSEKRINEDPLEPIRIRRIFKNRMETLVMRSELIRSVQANHTAIVLLQTELELLRLKTYPTLASFRTFS